MYNPLKAKATKELLPNPTRKRKRRKRAVLQNQRRLILIRRIWATKYATPTSTWSTDKINWTSTATCMIAALLSTSLMTPLANSTYSLTKNFTSPPGQSLNLRKDCKRRRRRPNPRPQKLTKMEDEESDLISIHNSHIHTYSTKHKHTHSQTHTHTSHK